MPEATTTQPDAAKKDDKKKEEPKKDDKKKDEPKKDDKKKAEEPKKEETAKPAVIAPQPTQVQQIDLGASTTTPTTLDGEPKVEVLAASPKKNVVV